MKQMSQWSDMDRAHAASGLRRIAEDAPSIPASWLRELATAIDNS